MHLYLYFIQSTDLPWIESDNRYYSRRKKYNVELASNFEDFIMKIMLFDDKYNRKKKHKTLLMSAYS